MLADDELDDLLDRWEELRASGHAVSAEALCRDCPELLEPLRRRIEALQSMSGRLDSREKLPDTRPMSDESAADAAAQPLPKRFPEVAGYEIVRELGRGGMGVVYLARQLRPDRLVALKMILGGAGQLGLARFRTEIEAVAQIQHPNIVHVHEVGEHDGQPYYTMEFVEGGSLAQRLESHLQPFGASARLLETLALAMHAVHQRGIVHRDLKPANVLLANAERRDGSFPLAECIPKITDFGVAKRLDDQAGPTLSGSVVGTPSYMAPEQATGKVNQTGPATDVYALGAILYRMLTGRPPFDAETAWDTIRQVATDDPAPPRRLQPRVPADLETICLKCLEKKAERRYASAEALAQDLHRFQAGEPIHARPVNLVERIWKWTKRRPAAAALLAVSALALAAFVGGGLVYQSRIRQALRDVQTRAEESRQRLVRLYVAQGAHALDEGDAFNSLVWLAEALKKDEGSPGREAMHRVRLAAALRQCPQLLQLWMHDAPVWHAEFSPDGKSVLTTSEDRTARVWDVGTGTAVGSPMRHDEPIRHGTFSADGQRVATAGRDKIARVWDARTGQPLTPPLRHTAPLTSVTFSPDGRSLLTTAEDSTARIWDAFTGKPRTEPLVHGKQVTWGAFSPDGSMALSSSDDHTARLWHADTGKPAAVLTHAGPVTHAVFDPTGKIVATASDDQTARLWDVATGKELRGPLKHRGPVVYVAFSRDGRRLATASADRTARVWDVSTGMPISPPLKQGSTGYAAEFGADGRWLVTASDDNTARVWDADTGDALTPLLKHNGPVWDTAFSPVDKNLLLTAGADGTVRLWRVDPQRSVLSVKTDGSPNQHPPAKNVWLSPDGTRSVTAEESRDAQIRDAKTGAPHGPPLRHGSVVLEAAFSPDGRRLVTASDDNTARIWDVATGELLTQPLKHHGGVGHAAFSPDGSHVATSGNDQMARVWDASTGEFLTPPLPFTGKAQAIWFGKDGKHVNVATTDGSIWTWSLQGDDRPVAELLTLAQLLAGGRIDATRGFLPLEPDALRRAWQQVRTASPSDLTAERR